MRCLYRTLVPRDLNCLFVRTTAAMSRGTSRALQRRSSAVRWGTSWSSLSSTEECVWLCSHVSSESRPRRSPHSPTPSNNKSLPRPTFQRTPLHLESIQRRHRHRRGHYLRFRRRRHGLSRCSRREFVHDRPTQHTSPHTDDRVCCTNAHMGFTIHVPLDRQYIDVPPPKTLSTTPFSLLHNTTPLCRRPPLTMTWHNRALQTRTTEGGFDAWAEAAARELEAETEVDCARKRTTS